MQSGPTRVKDVPKRTGRIAYLANAKREPQSIHEIQWHENVTFKLYNEAMHSTIQSKTLIDALRAGGIINYEHPSIPKRNSGYKDHSPINIQLHQRSSGRRRQLIPRE